MNSSLSYTGMRGATQDRTRTLFGQTMGLTMGDFQRLRRSANLDSAPLLAASIFLDALNVFLFFLRIFGNGRD